MVLKRKTYKKKKRVYRRKRVYRKRIRNVVPSGAAPVARKHLVKLKYSDVLDFNVGAGLVSTQQFRMNSVFDPDFSGIGHQPYGFDQLAALFLHYRVYKFSWHISFSPSNDRLHLCVVPVNNATTFTSISLAGEFPRAVSKVLAFDGGMPAVFKGSVYLPRLTGASSVQYKTDDRYSAAVSANPLEVLNLHAVLFNPTAAGVNTSVTFTLIFHTEFYDPIVLPQS